MFFGLNSVDLAILFLTAEKLEPLKGNEPVKSIGHDQVFLCSLPRSSGSRFAC